MNEYDGISNDSPDDHQEDGQKNDLNPFERDNSSSGDGDGGNNLYGKENKGVESGGQHKSNDENDGRRLSGRQEDEMKREQRRWSVKMEKAEGDVN